jgi:hypothetical protein
MCKHFKKSLLKKKHVSCCYSDIKQKVKIVIVLQNHSNKLCVLCYAINGFNGIETLIDLKKMRILKNIYFVVRK